MALIVLLPFTVNDPVYPVLDADAEYLQNGEDVSTWELLSDGFECPVGKRYTAHSFEFIKK